MIYFTQTVYYDHGLQKNALGKGRDDFFEIFRRMGYRMLAIPSFKPRRHLSVRERMIVEMKLTQAWRKSLKVLRSGDTLIIHSPNSEKFMAFAGLMKKLHNKGVKIITVTFELETFFVMDYKRFARFKRSASKRTEAELFELSDAIVVHNDVMKKKLVDAGFDGSKMFSIGVFDYLRDEALSEDKPERIGKDKPVIYAGHLTKEKSTFEYDLPYGFFCNLYGPDYTGPVNEYVDYMGAFDPVELMDTMEGSFGLVWEGNSVDGCDGAYGYYLSFNNPHKISLYLASGFPVISWNGAAMAHFIRKEKCGLTVDSLREVPGLIASLSEDEYESMRKNACRIGRGMREGVHVRRAIESALEYVDEQVR